MTDDTASSPRKAIPRRLRFEIFRRDGYTCRYCGASAPDAQVTIDHVIPIALGGTDDPSNLVTACTDCNAGKASTAPDQAVVEDVDATAFLLADALERAAAQRRLDRAQARSQVDQFDAIWNEWRVAGTESDRIGRPKNWQDSVTRFYENGLDAEEMREFVRVAMNADIPNVARFRYFCGCCWKEIGIRQEMARRIIEDEAAQEHRDVSTDRSGAFAMFADSMRLADEEAD